MADEAEQKSSIPLPPKLDLRKSGVLRPAAAARPVDPPAAPQMQAATPVQTHQTTIARPAATINVEPANANSKSSTMHIKISDEVPTIRLGAPVQAPPQSAGSTPTVELKKPVMVGAQPRPAMAAAKPLTVTPAPTMPTATARPASKTETSRIPLELATSTSAGAPAGKQTGDLKTIRIKAAPGMQSAQSSQEHPMDEKRKTSRISLEAALAMEDNKGGGEGGAPKTIRLKRPGETSASKASPVLATIKADAPARLSQTARLDEEIGATEEEGPSPTRRKTIKVKRPGDRASGGVAGVALSKGTGGDVEVSRAEPEEQEAGITWFTVTSLVASILAIITTFMIIWMLAAQAFGPNPSLTQLATGTTDLNWIQQKTAPLQY